ncbi:MAG: hypothetical protein CVV64_09365 [Candidatus Wallbacteria bacterium HGW-Wallbacteria-1]|jgi:hypothetical protein|uniref:Uncharacterized protein n=1 Tax=Candidatus Wallbacteria bacterium HGW-Wallbacteria-1 TaxID=2013854 RepID=A0A2N1PQF5_9BACT|nr:MAG: hypothetical protein CVV64_09365 [Candidatus Wallbacteria bacterium HGW-Wallbacteria-1]
MALISRGTGTVKLAGGEEFTLLVTSWFKKFLEVRSGCESGCLTSPRIIPASKLVHRTLMLPALSAKKQKSMATGEIISQLQVSSRYFWSSVYSPSTNKSGKTAMATLAIGKTDILSEDLTGSIPASLAVMNCWNTIFGNDRNSENTVIIAPLTDGLLMFLKKNQEFGFPRFIPWANASEMSSRIGLQSIYLSRMARSTQLNFQSWGKSLISQFLPHNLLSAVEWIEPIKPFAEIPEISRFTAESAGSFLEAASAALIQSGHTATPEIMMEPAAVDSITDSNWKKSIPAALLILSLGVAGNRYLATRIVEKQLNAIDQKMKIHFESVLPGKRMMAPLIQLEREIANQKTGKCPSELPLKVAEIISAIPKGVTLDWLGENNGELLFRGSSESLDSLGKMKTRINEQISNGMILKMDTEVDRKTILFQARLAEEKNFLAPEA